jgi:hypothetical protein
MLNLTTLIAIRNGFVSVCDHEEVYEALFTYFCNNASMPYGTAKARDGDPIEWIDNRLASFSAAEFDAFAAEVLA